VNRAAEQDSAVGAKPIDERHVVLPAGLLAAARAGFHDGARACLTKEQSATLRE
jgi:hypothetical protein